MKRRIGFAFLVALAVSASAQAVVRLQVRDGKTIVYNDGVGESSHSALAESDGWLASRVRIPSLYDNLIDQAAQVNAIDPKLLKSVMLIESAFDPLARSRKGARGLMQLMPETAARYRVRDILDPAENIACGAMHLRELLGRFGGDLSKSLAAYNAGESAVLRYGGVPPYQETQLYVHKGLTAYYGKSTLGGGFGRPTSQTWAMPTRPVRVTRDKNNRPVITTELAPRGTRRL